jgi:hypothetical protein
MSEVPVAGFRFPAGARNYRHPAPGPTRDVSDAGAKTPLHVPPSVQAGAGPIPAPADSRALVVRSNDTSQALTERPEPSDSDLLMSGRLDSDVRRLEDRINAAERLSEARLDAWFARLEHSLERTLQAQTDMLGDLTAKLEALGARHADGDAAAKGLAAQFETIRADRNEERRAARKRHILVIVAIVVAALGMSAAVIGSGHFSLGAVQIGATLPAPPLEEPVATSREQAEAQTPVQTPTPAPAQMP